MGGENVFRDGSGGKQLRDGWTLTSDGPVIAPSPSEMRQAWLMSQPLAADFKKFVAVSSGGRVMEGFVYGDQIRNAVRQSNGTFKVGWMNLNVKEYNDILNRYQDVKENYSRKKEMWLMQGRAKGYVEYIPPQRRLR